MPSLFFFMFPSLISDASSLVGSHMKRLWSGQSWDRRGIIPELGGLHTSAEAAASLSEDCVQAAGDIALGCSNVSVLVDDGGEVRADCASLAFLSLE